MPGDATTTIQELKDKVVAFRDERGWGKHHTQRGLAMSICIEAAELLEHFQWDELGLHDQDEIAAELADILIFAFNFADVSGIDISKVFNEKLEKAAKKYPVETFNPGNNKDLSQEYIDTKRAYRSKKGKA